MSWLRQPNTSASPSFLSAGLFFCWLGELCQGSDQTEYKDGGRTKYPRPWTAESNKLLDQFSCCKVCPPKHLSFVQATSEFKPQKSLSDASLQTSQHPAPNKAPHVTQVLPYAHTWHALLNYLQTTCILGLHSTCKSHSGN